MGAAAGWMTQAPPVGPVYGPSLADADLRFLATTAVLSAVGIGISFLLNAIGLTALFGRSGVPRWKAWIPYYQTWTWLRLGGQSGHWIWLSFIPSVSIVTRVFLCFAMYRIQIAFKKDSAFLILGVFIPWLWALLLGAGHATYQPELVVAAGFPPPPVGRVGPVATSALITGRGDLA